MRCLDRSITLLLIRFTLMYRSKAPDGGDELLDDLARVVFSEHSALLCFALLSFSFLRACQSVRVAGRIRAMESFVYVYVCVAAVLDRATLWFVLLLASVARRFYYQARFCSIRFARPSSHARKMFREKQQTRKIVHVCFSFSFLFRARQQLARCGRERARESDEKRTANVSNLL